MSYYEDYGNFILRLGTMSSQQQRNLSYVAAGATCLLLRRYLFRYHDL